MRDINKNYKIYVCGMTQNDKKNIDELTNQYKDYVDGHIWVDHGSTDGTRGILEERKGCGKIIPAKFYKYHCQSMNLFLFDGGMNIGDFFVLRDGQERFNQDFIKKIRGFCDTLIAEKINTVFSHGKPFIVRYYDDMHFIQSPHYSLQNFRNKAIDLKDYFEKEQDYAYRLWDGMEGGRSFDNKIKHELKYFYQYPISNHCALGISDRNEFVTRETNRINFRYYCYLNLGLEFTEESLLNYLSQENWKNDEKFVDMVDKERILKNYYRYYVLKHNFDDVMKSENDWSLKEYLK